MRKFTADFETTTDPNDCRVWAWAVCEIGCPTNFQYGTTIDSFMEWCEDPKRNFRMYFHNLKFDGAFIISWLLKNGFDHIPDKKDRRDKTFTTLITDMGVFYSIEVYFKVRKGKVSKITFYDSLKILNFSVAKIAKDFDLPISKLEIDYHEYRSKDHILTVKEIDYIRNDVEIMARALEKMFEQNLTKMTIASDALSDYKEMTGGENKFRKLFPLLASDIDADIRKSYKGGFTYLSDKWKGIKAYGVTSFDVNSLYPSRMVYCPLPYGIPEPFDGKYKYDRNYPLYMQKFTCTFDIKPDHIPSIQLKNNLSFMPNEYIKSTNGELVTLSLTSPDLELFFKQYDVENITWHGGWKFKSKTGLFTDYINKWTESKIQAKKDGNGSLYAISKLMLNSLYGKFGLSGKGAKKMPVVDNNGVVRWVITEEKERETIYIPVASFITAWARKYTIETSQMIREWGEEHKGFDPYIYSDTDSIKCCLTPEDVEEISKVIEVDDFKLGAWKNETPVPCRAGLFIRQKCYIVEEWNDKTQDYEMHVTVAGLPKSLGRVITFDNFKEGFTTEGMSDEEIGKDGRKKRFRYVEGGVILEDTEFTIK